MSGPLGCSIMWFRNDLRLGDNPALNTALKSSERTVCVYLNDSGHEAHGAEAWRARSLAQLDSDLRDKGASLVFRSGDPAQALAALARECGASSVHCSRDWTPGGRELERVAAASLADSGVELVSHTGAYLVDPDALLTRSGGPYRVFSPFFRAWRLACRDAVPFEPPDRIASPPLTPPTAGPHSKPVGGPDVERWWKTGETAALERRDWFFSDALADYERARDRPDVDGTSRLSPHLAHGEVAVRQIAASVTPLAERPGWESYVRQLAWREFAAHVLCHFPETRTSSLRPEFDAFAWRDDTEALDAWEAGCTGYPIVDAGMRQLLVTGWMHNRVRLVCGSFLTKHLLIDWREGERYFRHRLVDYDQASNVFNWQWIAGAGADAAPYFRIFNPVLQGARFDPMGAYVKRWVPELDGLDPRWVHQPWMAPAHELSAAGVTLGSSYPRPIVDHAEARIRALAAYAAIKGKPAPFV